jgi:hypothetical protein
MSGFARRSCADARGSSAWPAAARSPEAPAAERVVDPQPNAMFQTGPGARAEHEDPCSTRRIDCHGAERKSPATPRGSSHSRPREGRTIARASAKSESSPTSRARLVGKESDLYDPFVDWLKAELEGQPGFAHAKRTASAKGWASGSGKWSRPDVTAVQVITYEWLPQVTVEILSYEIKRYADAQKLESVYEAAAHQRWAHRASMVVELDREAGALPDAMLDELHTELGNEFRRWIGR